MIVFLSNSLGNVSLGRQRQAIGMRYFRQNSSKDYKRYFRIPLGSKSNNCSSYRGVKFPAFDWYGNSYFLY